MVLLGEGLLRLQGAQPTVSFTRAGGGATVMATASRNWGCRLACAERDVGGALGGPVLATFQHR